MARRTTLLALAALVAFAASCSINNTRSLGQDCLQDRECVQGLACLPDPNVSGRTTCQPYLDGSSVTGSDDARANDAPASDAGTGNDASDDAAASD